LLLLLELYIISILLLGGATWTKARNDAQYLSIASDSTGAKLAVGYYNGGIITSTSGSKVLHAVLKNNSRIISMLLYYYYYYYYYYY